MADRQALESNDPSKRVGGFAASQLQPPSVPATTAPVSASTATTCAPTTPVTDDPGDGAGKMASANGFAGMTRPRKAPTFSVSFASGYCARMPVRSSSASGRPGPRE